MYRHIYRRIFMAVTERQ